MSQQSTEHGTEMVRTLKPGSWEVTYDAQPFQLLDHAGQGYVVCRPVVRALRLPWSSQRRHLRRLSDAALQLCQLENTGRRGGAVLSIPLAQLRRWLYSLDASECGAEAAVQILRYRDALPKALAAAWEQCRQEPSASTVAAKRTAEVKTQEVPAVPKGASVHAALTGLHALLYREGTSVVPVSLSGLLALQVGLYTQLGQDEALARLHRELLVAVREYTDFFTIATTKLPTKYGVSPSYQKRLDSPQQKLCNRRLERLLALLDRGARTEAEARQAWQQVLEKGVPEIGACLVPEAEAVLLYRPSAAAPKRGSLRLYNIPLGLFWGRLLADRVSTWIQLPFQQTPRRYWKNRPMYLGLTPSQICGNLAQPLQRYAAATSAEVRERFTKNLEN